MLSQAAHVRLQKYDGRRKTRSKNLKERVQWKRKVVIKKFSMLGSHTQKHIGMRPTDSVPVCFLILGLLWEIANFQCLEFINHDGREVEYKVLNYFGFRTLILS